MPYEEAIPPVPTREQELQMIEQTQNSWEDQSWLDYTQAESDRLSKKHHAEKIAIFNRNWPRVGHAHSEYCAHKVCNRCAQTVEIYSHSARTVCMPNSKLACKFRVW